MSTSDLDHAKYIKEYVNAGIEVYASDEVQEKLEIKTGEYCKGIAPMTTYHIGNFTVKPFDNVHDVPCLGFLIEHEEMGKLLFATDTEYVKYRFKNLNHILIECNYDKAIIDEIYHKSLRDRVLSSHTELQTTLNFLEKNKSNNLFNVVLLHLSNGTSDEVKFLEESKKVVNCPVYIADKGLEVELMKEPF